jgi:glucose-1-phosphate thymidylyltransferase
VNELPDLVGLVPAAGHALRLGPLPCSKELLPVGWSSRDAASPRVEVACGPLLAGLRAGGVRRAFVVLRSGKWDLPAYLARSPVDGLELAYVVRESTPSLPASLDAAYPFLRGCHVALGFPDVLFAPSDAFARLRSCAGETGADLVLGLFPARRPESTDMVALGADRRVTAIEVRPARTTLRLAWLLAVWGPAFGEHLHSRVAADRNDGAAELQIGEVVGSALAAGLDVRGVELPGASYRDLGTPEELAASWREGSWSG